MRLSKNEYIQLSELILFSRDAMMVHLDVPLELFLLVGEELFHNLR